MAFWLLSRSNKIRVVFGLALPVVVHVLGQLSLYSVLTTVAVADDTGRGARSCVLEPCHGLNIKCTESTRDMACTAMYQLGDNCRAEARCERVDGRCTLIKTEKFESCKRCVEQCTKKHQNDSELPDMFSCEASCMGHQ